MLRLVGSRGLGRPSLWWIKEITQTFKTSLYETSFMFYSSSNIYIYRPDKLCSLLEIMLCGPKFVFLCCRLRPELDSPFLVEGVELQHVCSGVYEASHWTLFASSERYMRKKARDKATVVYENVQKSSPILKRVQRPLG